MEEYTVKIQIVYIYFNIGLFTLTINFLQKPFLLTILLESLHSWGKKYNAFYDKKLCHLSLKICTNWGVNLIEFSEGLSLVIGQSLVFIEDLHTVISTVKSSYPLRVLGAASSREGLNWPLCSFSSKL